MFKENVQPNQQRLILPYFVLCLVLVIYLLTLFSKSVLGHKYYSYLSEKNRTKEIQVIAPRGVFLDRSNRALVSNQKSAKYGYTRHYLYPEATAHLLGYLSLPDEVNLEDYSCGAPPLPNQFMGKTGLEKYFECELRGKAGKSINEVNALGEKTRELARQEAIQGQNIQLSISLSLQRKAQSALVGKRGAVIATEPQTGEVLLFYSSPSFDPNRIVEEPGLYADLISRKDKPLFDRLSSGLYPPGSVIKPLIALGALEEEVVTENTIFNDEGIFKLGGVEFGNWYFIQYGKTEGEVDVVKAIKRSNDIYFYHLGVEMGLPKIKEWFTTFGLAKQDLLGYLPQSKSLLPSSKWKEQALGEPWYLGDTVNLSIGQGYLLVNPIQMHQAIAILANEGEDCGLTFKHGDLRPCRSLDLTPEHLEVVTKGMVAACRNGGTAWPFFDFKVRGKSLRVACKTGTAEAGGDKAMPHAWFTVFAPAVNPEIILTVLLENGGEGSTDAAPIAREILDEFFSHN